MNLDWNKKEKELETNKKLSRSELSLDYLGFVADFRHFNAKTSKHRNLVVNYMENIGIEIKSRGDDWVYFENKDMGVSAYFSNFPMNNKKIAMRPTLALNFSGRYFVYDNAYASARKIARFFTKKFGSFFKINRCDIAQDIYGAITPYDYFPDFRSSKTNLKWALRGKPKFGQYNNDFTEKIYGFEIKSSRYKIMSYNRQMSLDNRYQKGEILKTYFDYYKKLYRGRNVQRLEIKLKSDACNFFALLFFRGNKSMKEVLELALANFGRTHSLKEIDGGKELCKMPVNKVFAELFYFNKKEDVQIFKIDFKRQTGVSFSEMTFSKEGKSINEIVKMLGKRICEKANGSEEQRIFLMKNTVMMLKDKIKEFENIVNDRIGRCKKTFNFMEFNLLEMMEEQTKIKNFFLLNDPYELTD